MPHPKSFGGSGEVIRGSRCPRCSQPMEYNGNYWCSECPWVLRERASKEDEDAFKVAYVLLMKQRGLEPNPRVLNS